MSAVWAAWSQDWILNDKVSFDGSARIIYVHSEVTSLDIRIDVYSAWVSWIALRDNTKFLPATRYTGYDQIGPGIYTGDTYFLINGWKLAVDLRKVKVTGVLFSDDYDTAYYTPDLVPQYPATVSSLVTTVSTAGSVAGSTPSEIWAYSNRSLTQAPAYNGPTVTQIREEMDSYSAKLAQIKAIVESMDIPTPAENAAATWDAKLVNHTIGGTYGEELATHSDIQAAAATNTLYHTDGAIIYGTIKSGTITNTDIRNNIYWEIYEDAAAGLTVEYTFNIPDQSYRPGVITLFGRYDGKGSSHYIELWAWNIERMTWELLHEDFMRSTTIDEEFNHSYYEQHIDRTTGNVKIRLIHNITAYHASHVLSIDSLVLTAINVVTAQDIATAVWSAPVAAMTDKTTIGGYIKKALLTIPAFLGLK